MNTNNNNSGSFWHDKTKRRRWPWWHRGQWLSLPRVHQHTGLSWLAPSGQVAGLAPTDGRRQWRNQLRATGAGAPSSLTDWPTDFRFLFNGDLFSGDYFGSGRLSPMQGPQMQGPPMQGPQCRVPQCRVPSAAARGSRTCKRVGKYFSSVICIPHPYGRNWSDP